MGKPSAGVPERKGRSVMLRGTAGLMPALRDVQDAEPRGYCKSCLAELYEYDRENYCSACLNERKRMEG